MTQNYNTKGKIAEKREHTRSWLAKMSLVCFFILLIVCLFLITFFKIDTSLSSQIQAIISAFASIVGVVLGYYFGKGD